MILLLLLGGFYGCSSTNGRPDILKQDPAFLTDPEDEKWFQLHSNAFQEAYKSESRWKHHRLTILAYSFLARDGMRRYLQLSGNQQDKLDGIRLFLSECEKHDGAIEYLGRLASIARGKEIFESNIQTEVDPNSVIQLALADYVRFRGLSDNGSPRITKSHDSRGSPPTGSPSEKGENGTSTKKQFELLQKGLDAFIGAQFYYNSLQGFNNHPEWMVKQIHEGLSRTLSFWTELQNRLQAEFNPPQTPGEKDANTPALWNLINKGNQHPFNRVTELLRAEIEKEKKVSESDLKEISIPFHSLTQTPEEEIMARVRSHYSSAIENMAEDRPDQAFRHNVRALAFLERRKLYRRMKETGDKEATVGEEEAFYHKQIRNALRQIFDG